MCLDVVCVVVQVPDIYDSAKYDAIHNRELGLDLQALYEVRIAMYDRRRTAPRLRGQHGT